MAQFCELFKKAITDFKLIVFPFCSASVELIFGETVVNKYPLFTCISKLLMINFCKTFRTTFKKVGQMHFEEHH